MNLRIPSALPQWAELAERKAREHGFDPSLVLALIWQESSGNWQASREEPGFTWFFSPERGPLHDRRLSTKQNRDKARVILNEEVDPGEFKAQSTSHGLTQVMLSTARELRYTGTVEDLYNPEINLDYGCRYLKLCIKRAKGDLRGGLLRYNGGANPAYDDEVLEKFDLLKSLET